MLCSLFPVCVHVCGCVTAQDGLTGSKIGAFLGRYFPPPFNDGIFFYCTTLFAINMHESGFVCKQFYTSSFLPVIDRGKQISVSRALYRFLTFHLRSSSFLSVIGPILYIRRCSLDSEISPSLSVLLPSYYRLK